MSTCIKKASWWLAGVLLLVLPAAGQMQVGDNLNMNLSGTLSGGYSGTYGNLIDSSHSLDLGGTGTLSGFYYNPSFLTFNVSPYYNQSRANSNFQSISDASGFTFNSGIFNGSHFPGSISYAKSYNSEGNFAVPGVADFTTHGNTDTFGINWSENLPDVPSLTANFQMGSNQYSVYGTDQNGDSAFHSFGLRSGYLLDGFGLSAFYTTGASHSDIPQVYGNFLQTQTTHADNDGYGFSATHALPLRGGWGASFTRSNFGNDYAGYSYNGTIDTITSSAGVQPTEKLHLSFNVNYTDNLTGVLYQWLIPAGGPAAAPLAGAPLQNQNQSSNSLDLVTNASYSVLDNLQTQLYAERRTQYFLGTNYGANSFGGGATYGHNLFGGNLNASASVTENVLDNSSQSTLGFTTTVNYNRRIQQWYLGGVFSYAQNNQTFLVTYTNSFYNYSANVRRRFGRFSWSAIATAAQTGLTAQPGTDSNSKSISTSLGFAQWINVYGSYSKSHGNALLSGGGLVPIPLPVVIPPSLLLIYGGKSYSFGLGSSPVRHLTLSASFAHANNDTINAEVASWNKTEQINTLIQYQFRKMYFTGGYSKLLQGFSASGYPPSSVSTFYAGVSRWFNFF